MPGSAALEAALAGDEDQADVDHDDQGDDDDGPAETAVPGAVRASLWPVCGPWRRSGRIDGTDRATDALVTTSGDDGIRTHDPLLAKQVL